MATDDAVTRIVVMDAFPDGPVSLDYYAADFGYNGGTMHGSRQDALEECDGEFGASLGAWTPIPDDVDNLEQFVLRRVAAEFS